MGITSSVSAGLQDDGELEVRIDLSSESSLWEYPWFDYVTEEQIVINSLKLLNLIIK